MTNRATREEFEQAYAERSRVTVEWLHDNNRVAVACECEMDSCNGWAMAHTLDTNQILPVDWADVEEDSR